MRLVVKKVIWRYWHSHERHHVVAALEEKLDDAKRERMRNYSYMFVAAFQDLPLGTYALIVRTLRGGHHRSQ